MHRLLMIFYFLIFINDIHAYVVDDGKGPPTPNFHDSLWGKVYFYFSENKYFTINSSYIKYGDCPILCSVKKDCRQDSLKCFSGDSLKLRLEVTNHISEDEKNQIFEEHKKKNSIYSDYVIPFKPTVTYDLGINRYHLNDVLGATKYFLRNKNNYYMSDWLKSINCKSMNFVALVNNPKIAKTKLYGRFERVDGKLYYNILIDTKNSKRIEVDESTGEMKYLSKSHFSAYSMLYTLQELNVNENKIPAINFCESFFDL